MSRKTKDPNTGIITLPLSRTGSPRKEKKKEVDDKKADIFSLLLGLFCCFSLYFAF
jgi:hypothetical protein